MIVQTRLPRRSGYLAMAAVLAAAVLTPCMAGVADDTLVRVGLFYVAVSLAYVLMPYARRGDIPLVAMWVVLAAELAPLAAGQLISPRTTAADVAGVLMAAGPIYIARARQLMQGDARPRNRRATETRFA